MPDPAWTAVNVQVEFVGWAKYAEWISIRNHLLHRHVVCKTFGDGVKPCEDSQHNWVWSTNARRIPGCWSTFAAWLSASHGHLRVPLRNVFPQEGPKFLPSFALLTFQLDCLRTSCHFLSLVASIRLMVRLRLRWFNMVQHKIENQPFCWRFDLTALLTLVACWHSSYKMCVCVVYVCLQFLELQVVQCSLTSCFNSHIFSGRLLLPPSLL
jgi:hypothetical protein